MDKPLINILTRTSNRPVGFSINYESISTQTYDNINHIVGYDNDSDLEYLNGYDNILKVKIDRDELIKNDTSVNPNTGKYSPHNLYLNELIKHVESGWIIYLDDDDRFMHNRVIEQIVKEINKVDDDTLLVWRFKLGDRLILPIEFGPDNPPTIGRIGGSCMTFHSKYSNTVKWDSWKCSDYRVIEKLYQNIPNHIFIKKTYVYAPVPGSGNKKDLIGKLW